MPRQHTHTRACTYNTGLCISGSKRVWGTESNCLPATGKLTASVKHHSGGAGEKEVCAHVHRTARELGGELSSKLKL